MRKETEIFEYKLVFPNPPEPKLSPIDYFYLYFPKGLISYIASQSKLYATQNNRYNFSVTDNEMTQFIGILIFMGIVQMPDMRMYWAEGTRLPTVADIFSRNRFFEILSNLHFNDNNTVIIDRTDQNMIDCTKFGQF